MRQPQIKGFLRDKIANKCSSNVWRSWKTKKDEGTVTGWRILGRHNSQMKCRILVQKKNNREKVNELQCLQLNSIVSILFIKLFIIIWNVNIRAYWVKWEFSVVFFQLSVSLKLFQKLKKSFKYLHCCYHGTKTT